MSSWTARLSMLPQRGGYASLDPNEQGKDMTPLFDTILNYIPAPEGDPEAPTQVLISTIDYNEYVGRIGVWKSRPRYHLREPGCGYRKPS